MASGLLLLLDDITSVLDDVATLTKVAVKKTSGVLGDDLALNAQQVSGVAANRELPIVWAVAKGSFINKAILVPSAILLSQFASWSITPLLIVGGAYLCFEGVEKLVHNYLHKKHHNEHTATEIETQADSVPEVPSDASQIRTLEKSKISGAIRTDFILSAEIVVITLGSVAGADLWTRIGVLVTIAILMTVGVYGLVAGIVKLDDLGGWLLASKSSGFGGSIARKLGYFLLLATPYLMTFLSIAGTAAMFLVGGGIVLHGIEPLHHWIEHYLEPLRHVGQFGALAETFVTMLIQATIGVIVGAIVLAVVAAAKQIWSRRSNSHQTSVNITEK